LKNLPYYLILGVIRDVSRMFSLKNENAKDSRTIDNQGMQQGNSCEEVFSQTLCDPDTLLLQDLELIQKIAHIVKAQDIGEIEYVRGQSRLRIASKPPAIHSIAPGSYIANQQQGQPIHHYPGAYVGHSAPQIKETLPEPEEKPQGFIVEAQMVGTAYLCPQPGANPFVCLGDTVSEGQILMVIEAMKVMNPVKAEKGGTVTEICIADGSPVEFGQALVRLI
jgi:acetyl-CoA carboxylase biotin carboxyl carrier protein